MTDFMGDREAVATFMVRNRCIHINFFLLEIDAAQDIRVREYSSLREVYFVAQKMLSDVLD